MAGSRELRRVKDSVVRFGRAVERACARPSCSTPARATLTFRYATREAWIERLTDETSPQAYDLCSLHAARTQPPSGWQLRDRRPEDERRPDVPVPTPVDLGGDRTVAVLAAALRAVPDVVSEDDLRAPAAEVDLAATSPTPVVAIEEAASPLLERSRHVARSVDEAPTDARSAPPGPLELDLGFPVLRTDGPDGPDEAAVEESIVAERIGSRVGPVGSADAAADDMPAGGDDDNPATAASAQQLPVPFPEVPVPAAQPAASLPRPPIAVRPRRSDPPSPQSTVAADW